MHFFVTQFTTLAWVMMGKQNTTIKYLQSKRTRSFQNHVYVRIMYLVLTFKKNHPPTPLLSKIFYIRQITNQLINSEVLEKIFLHLKTTMNIFFCKFFFWKLYIVEWNTFWSSIHVSLHLRLTTTYSALTVQMSGTHEIFGLYCLAPADFGNLTT